MPLFDTTCRRAAVLAIAVPLACAASSCATVHGPGGGAGAPSEPTDGAAARAPQKTGGAAARDTAPEGGASPAEQRGKASYYSDKLKGRKTASGERYDPEALTAAHRTLPFGTWVLVTTEKGLSVRVKINDRGPFGDSARIIDLSKRAAREIGLIRAGVMNVTVRVVDGP